MDSRKLFAHAKTAGILYHAHLRHELTARLGVAWRPVVNGHADIDGVDRELIDTFSRRRTAIVAHMEERGNTSAAAAQTATLATRQAKGERMSEAELRDTWTRRAASAGVRPGWQQQLIGRTSWEQPDVAELRRQLVVDEGLTRSSSSFTRRDVLHQLAGRLPAGAPVGWCERVAEVLLTSDTDLLVALGPTRGHLTSVDVIRRGEGKVVPADPGERRYTTKGLLLTEQHAINRSLDRHDDRVAIVAPRVLERALRRRTLTDEQEQMVRRLTGSGAGVQVVVGKAGTGKTYALDTADDAWETSGIRVTGVALAARAALELQESAGIRSTTLARLLGQVDDGRDGSPLQPGSVLVVAEAGMVGTRQLARLLHHAEAQSVKVVLVGDPKQLPEINAGGLFRALATRLPAIELTDNRRQQHGWEQAALDELRHGNPDAALATYRQHGRIRSADTAQQLRDRLVDDWWNTAKENLSGSLMIALRRDDVDDLNHRARTKMLAAGRLTRPAIITTNGVQLQAGDRIVCLRNDRRLGVVNGTRATITRTDRHEDGLHHHTHLDDRDEVASLASRIRRTRAADPITELSDLLGARIRQLEAFLARPDVQRQQDLATFHGQLTTRLAHDRTSIEALDAQLAELPRGLRGLARRQQRDELTRQRRWRPTTLAQNAPRLAELDRQLAGLPSRRHLQASTDELARLRAELYGRAKRAVVRCEATAPQWLVAALGTPPHDPRYRARWRAAARALERHRLGWSITDPRQAFGNEIVSPTQSDEQRRVQQHLEETRQQLYPHLCQALRRTRAR